MTLILCLALGIIVLSLLFIGISRKPKDTLKQVGLATSIKNTGFESGSTILIIRSIIMNSLKKDGFHVVDLSIVHEFEGRYQGVIQTQEHGQSILKIIVDRLGNVQWSVVD